jgi:hypothetical protein
MKRIMSTLLAAIGAFGALAFAATSAEAQHRRHHHHHHGSRVGVYIGAPLLFSPWYYHPRPYYYDPYYRPVVVREQPVVYVEQYPPVAAEAAPQAQAQPQPNYWFFCQDTQTYYPHVQNCATPWQRVIPHAPR